MTMVAVGDAAEDMMNFIIDDMKKVRLKKQAEPNYQECIQISTNASLWYMIAPGLMVILVPIVGGILFGPKAVEGILAGSIVSGVQVAISASNTGGACDNAKKETEKRRNQFYDYAKAAGADGQTNWPEFKEACKSFINEDGEEDDNKKGFLKEVKAEFDAMNDQQKDDGANNDNEEERRIFKFKALA